MPRKVILVDRQDRPIGTEWKIRAHRLGRLHRAFSVFVFDRRGRLLLQQRDSRKYHSGGLWTNTCCSHPSPGESVLAAAHRRLREEMGFDCTLRQVFGFLYRVRLDRGLTEHEYDHVLVGRYNGRVRLNRREAATAQWIRPTDLEEDLRRHPEKYTYWLKKCWPRLRQHLRRHPLGSPRPRTVA